MTAQGPISSAIPRYDGAYLAEVLSVDDPERLARVQLRLHGRDGDAEAPQWARVVVPVAGAERGAFLIPDVGDEVVVTFLGGDPRFPVVMGGVWNGAAPAPEEIAGNVDRWTFTGKAGTRIAILEDAGGRERVEIETPAGTTAVVTDEGGGRVELQASGSTITIDSSGVSIEASGTVSIDASRITASAGMVNFDCGFSNFSGVVKCDVIIANSVVGSSYTPGAGNIW